MRIASIILLFIIGLGAIAAGYGLITDPSGKAIGIPIEYLTHSGFDNFLIPGIILLTVIGVTSIMIGIITIKKDRPYPILMAIQGAILAGWIIIQVILVRDFNWLHISCLAIGVLLIYFGITIDLKDKPL